MLVKKGTDLTDDDFQTDEDRQWRLALQVSMEKEGKRLSKESNFKLNVDF
jgi:hypothetical protein